MTSTKQYLKILFLTVGVFFIFSTGSFIENSYAEVTPLQVKQAYNNGVESSKKVCFDTGYDHRKNDQENFSGYQTDIFAKEVSNPYSTFTEKKLYDEFLLGFKIGCGIHYNLGYSKATSEAPKQDTKDDIYARAFMDGYSNPACYSAGERGSVNDVPKAYDQKNPYGTGGSLAEAYFKGYDSGCGAAYREGKLKTETIKLQAEEVGEKLGIDEEKFREQFSDEQIEDLYKQFCIIATASYGSPLAPEVQMLREIRDNQLLKTESGSAFMSGFNTFYYSFSPTVAKWELENPIFKEVVKTTITPLITSLSILNYVDMDSEAKVLGYGISLILLNVGMYFVAPAVVIWQVKKRI